MSKITRKVARLFGSTAGATEVKQFGSLAAGAPVQTADPDTIQALANWLTGWYGAVIGNNSPALQDWNAFSLVMAYQIAYLMQAGVAEWEAQTTYYKGSLAQVGGQVFVSIVDTNLNNAVTDSTKWVCQEGAPVNLTFANTGYVLSGTNAWEKTALVNTASGATSVVFPAASTCKGRRLTLVKTSADVNGIVATVTGGGTINGAASQTYDTQYAAFEHISTGTEWVVL